MGNGPRAARALDLNAKPPRSSTLPVMFPAKVAVVCGLMALLVSACGVSSKPLAGTGNLNKVHSFYGVADDPRTPHTKCLKAAGVTFYEYTTKGQKYPAIQVGTLPTGPTIIFQPTPGAAQDVQITGQVQGAEVIGSALLYPNQASSKLLSIVESCTAVGVSG